MSEIIEALELGTAQANSPSVYGIGDLKNYQRQIINHITSKPEANIWSFMGSGKTVSLLTAYLILRETMPDKKLRLLVIAPLMVCDLTWEQEVRKWSHLNGNISVGYMTGTPKERANALFNNYDLTLTNYENIAWLVQTIEKYYIGQGYELPYDMVVYDEVSKLKRRESKRFAELARILPYFKRRVGMTASPSSNGYENVWGQCYVTDMGKRLTPDYKVFLSKYFSPPQGRSKWLPRGDTLDSIVKAIADNTIIIPAEGNQDIPPLQEKIEWVTLTPKVYQGYLTLEAEFFAELDGVGGDVSKIEVLNEISLNMKLLQYASGCVYQQTDPEDINTRTEHDVHKKKYERLADIYDATGDEPLLVVYQFASERKRIEKMYPDCRVLVGTTQAEAREIQDEFNSGKLKLLLTHSASAGFGINLQQACHRIVLFGLSPNQEHMEQVIGRVYRTGQKLGVIVHMILSRDTRDEVMYEMFHDKTCDQNKLKDAMDKWRRKLGL